jgi:uncharacterized membrane protein
VSSEGIFYILIGVLTVGGAIALVGALVSLAKASNYK